MFFCVITVINNFLCIYVVFLVIVCLLYNNKCTFTKYFVVVALPCCLFFRDKQNILYLLLRYIFYWSHLSINYQLIMEQYGRHAEPIKRQHLHFPDFWQNLWAEVCMISYYSYFGNNKWKSRIINVRISNIWKVASIVYYLWLHIRFPQQW